jgi:heptosyltransferase-3
VKPPRRILVVCIQRLGDVLLATALISALARQWPAAQIDVLVNANSAVTLQGNPDIGSVIVQQERPSLWQVLAMIWRIFRRYDLAICTVSNDRPYLYTLMAAPLRAGVVAEGESGSGLKKRAMHFWIPDRFGVVHMLEQYLRLADQLGLRVPSSEVVPPRPADESGLNKILGENWRESPYAVVHLSAMFRYKAWTAAGWQHVVHALIAKGLRVYLTGGKAEHERALTRAIAQQFPDAEVSDLSGRFAFSELTPLIESARIFIGPDTSVTHLAAATGVPTVALFGPGHPVTWAPWPRGFGRTATSPWVKIAPLQQQNNVWVVQGIKACVPCLLEGCDRKLDSHSECLDDLPASRVIAVADQILATNYRNG